MFDPREHHFAEMRREDMLRRATQRRFEQRVCAQQRRGSAFYRPFVVWAARRLITSGVRLLILSKSWDSHANNMYNQDNSDLECFAVETVNK